jgi:Protein of unknown function (DUF5672)
LLPLPDVTVVITACVNHALAQQAIQDTLGQIAPAATHVWSNRPLDPRTEWFEADFKSLDDVAWCLWTRIPREIKTSHYLTIQWDGWVLDGALWNPEWLDLDYIGAPWPWHRTEHRVGNGGFSLRSAEMGRFLANNVNRFPPHHPEDDTLCRRYRNSLESMGFAWASPSTAARFSFERSPARATFGFHGVFNWPHVMPRKALDERIALADDYARRKTEWREMLDVKEMLDVIKASA